jgi:hypothetical protein
MKEIIEEERQGGTRGEIEKDIDVGKERDRLFYCGQEVVLRQKRKRKYRDSVLLREVALFCQAWAPLCWRGERWVA